MLLLTADLKNPVAPLYFPFIWVGIVSVTGSFKVNLPSKCSNNFFGGPTTLYQLEKGFKSSGNNIVLKFYDELYQPNAIDKDGVPQNKCDESWSIDNIKVRLIKYEWK